MAVSVNTEGCQVNFSLLLLKREKVCLALYLKFTDQEKTVLLVVYLVFFWVIVLSHGAVGLI